MHSWQDRTLWIKENFECCLVRSCAVISFSYEEKVWTPSPHCPPSFLTHPALYVGHIHLLHLTSASNIIDFIWVENFTSLPILHALFACNPKQGLQSYFNTNMKPPHFSKLWWALWSFLHSSKFATCNMKPHIFAFLLRVTLQVVLVACAHLDPDMWQYNPTWGMWGLRLSVVF